MKRRSFLQWCLGVLGVGTVGVPAVKARGPLDVRVVGLTQPEPIITLGKQPEYSAIIAGRV